MAAKSISKTFIWILMGLLILGLGGFGVTNLGGTLRSVGSVGDADIGVNAYYRGLNNEIRAIEAERGEPVSFNQARQMGVTEAVLARLVAQASLEHETIQMSLSVGDANLRDQIVDIPQFSGIDGTFDREAYAFSLERAGLSEYEFEENIRLETASGFLQAAVMAGVNMPAAYTQALTTYLGERRDASWAVLQRQDLQVGLPVPEEADLTAFHGENADRFTRPETKRITYAWLTPDMILDTVEVDEDALRQTYDDRADEFNQPERRLLERLVYPDTDAAAAAKARIDAGETTFEEEVEARGLALADIDLGDMARDALGTAGDVVFAASVGDVAGPVDSDLGPALFRVNAILSQQVTSFEDARADLRRELAQDRARRVIEATIDPVDDLLAGGATIEDLVQETDMQLGQIDWHSDVTDDIGAYDGFRAAAADLTADDYPEVIQLDDGGIFAMRLDEVVPPALIPLDEVRDEVAAAWEADTATRLLREDAEARLEKLQGGASFEEVGLTLQGAQALTRRGFQLDTPAAFIDTVFGMNDGEVRLIDGDARVFVLRLDKVLPPDPEDSDLAQLEALLRDQAAAGLSQDLFQLLANDIRARAGISLDQQALNAVHSNFQ